MVVDLPKHHAHLCPLVDLGDGHQCAYASSREGWTSCKGFPLFKEGEIWTPRTAMQTPRAMLEHQLYLRFAKWSRSVFTLLEQADLEYIRAEVEKKPSLLPTHMLDQIMGYSSWSRDSGLEISLSNLHSPHLTYIDRSGVPILQYTHLKRPALCVASSPESSIKPISLICWKKKTKHSSLWGLN